MRICRFRLCQCCLDLFCQRPIAIARADIVAILKQVFKNLATVNIKGVGSR